MAYIDTSALNNQPIQNNSKSSGFGFGDFLGSLFSPLTSLFGSIMNYKSQKDTNKTNMAINQQNLDYNAAMTQAQWERDDNAHQREVADLEAAGLSPLASTQGSGVSQALGAPSPIAMQAPQFDVNTLVNSLIQNKQLSETKRHNLVQEGYEETELLQNAEELKQKSRQLDIQDKKTEADIQYQCDLIENQAKQINETIRHNKESEKLQQTSISSEIFFKEIQHATHGQAYAENIYDFDEYVEKYKAWTSKYQKFVETLEQTSHSASSSYNSGFNGSLGVDAFKTGGLNGQVGSSEGGSGSSSENVSQRVQAQIDAWLHDNPVPVYHRKWF